MPRGDTSPPKRANFDETADESHQLVMSKRSTTYPCRANGCPMPGTIFSGATDGEGICAWHYSAEDLPKVTRVLNDWECLTIAINRGRAFICNPDVAANVKRQREMLLALWSDVSSSVTGSGWKIRTEPFRGEILGDWVRRMEQFLNNRVKEVVNGIVITDDNAPTITVAKMRERLRGNLALSGESKWAE